MAASRFVGGPLDGLTLDPQQVNALSHPLAVPTESGSRQILLMPSREDCERAMRGEIAAAGLLRVVAYEHESRSPTEVVYSFAGDTASVLVALSAPPPPLSPEEEERKQYFGQVADKFIEQVRQAELTGATEVNVVYHCTDSMGDPLPPCRRSLAPLTRRGVPGDRDAAYRYALEDLRNGIITNINANVRNCPVGLMPFPGNPDLQGRVVGFDLEIQQP